MTGHTQLSGRTRSGWVLDACHERVKVGMVFIADYRGTPDQEFTVVGDRGTGLFEVRRPDGDVGLMRPSTILNVATQIKGGGV